MTKDPERSDWLVSLSRCLRAAGGFEEAAEATARALLDRCEEALAASSFAGRANLLRTIVHLRPRGAYTRLAAVTPREMGAASSRAHCEVAASASAYRWVQEHESSVAIDVYLGQVTVHESGRFVDVDAGPAGAFESKTSRMQLLDRNVTHLFAVPLRAPLGGTVGMLSIEADARPAMGTPFLWEEIAGAAELIADLAVSSLLGLPSRVEGAPTKDPLLPVLGESMRGLIGMLRVFAEQEETILLSGPAGAGKSRLARWCHVQSPRAEKPFVVLDLSAFPENLREAELFGWRKGAFTGASADNPGAVGRAAGGTLFIDEIDKLSMEVQAALLRLLEERTYRVLGDASGDKTADVRFLIGTNADLPALVRAGKFRHDLYYRINVLPVRIPSLAERRDEISEWAAFMLERRHGNAQGPAPALSEGARKTLEAAPWPGNLRQLDNILRRAYVLFLAERGGASGAAVIDKHHIDRALAYEGAPADTSLLDALHAAATAFVLEAERRKTSSDLDPDLALPGFILGAAVQKTGNVEEAFHLLGRSNLVRHRNHKKTLRRELERVSQLYAALVAGPSPFDALLDGEDD